jgi:predicted kinase
MNRLVIFLCGLVSTIAIMAQQLPSLNSLIKDHIAHLSNRDTENQPLLIAFTATPGMGKTTIAKQLENELHGIRITLDEGRIAMKKQGIYPITGTLTDKIACTMNYLDALLQELKQTCKNQLIILDDSVDRMYQPIMAIAHKHKIPMFIIKINASKETAIARIKARDADTAKDLLAVIDQWYEDYRNFNQKLVSYAIDNNGTNNTIEITPLVTVIKAKSGARCL